MNKGKNKLRLWDRNFTIITLGTIISAIGGVALNFALNIVIYNETNSTILTGIYSAITAIPQIILPVFAAPYIDRLPRKKLIVLLDYLLGIIYISFGIYLFTISFNYYAYVVLGMLSSIIGSVYGLTYNSLFPDLIPEGCAQKGYSVSVLIYPSIAAVFTPIAAFVYQRWGIEIIFVIEGILLFIAATFEVFIKYKERNRVNRSFNFKEYDNDIKEGFVYLRKEKGIFFIYLYMTFASFASEGISLLLIPFFQTHAIYTTTNYSLLLSAETFGRMIGGLLHYMFKIPENKRYTIASKVYIIYEILDGVLMFLAYPLMIVIRFILGFLGVNSANIRESSVQNYIPREKRARVNSFFQIMAFGGILSAKLIAGALGEFMNYKFGGLIFGTVGFIAAVLCIFKHDKEIKVIYNKNL